MVTKTMSATFRSHLLTIAPTIRGRIVPYKAPPSVPWGTCIQDPDVGPVVLSGKLTRLAKGRRLVVIVHGLSGGPDSFYCLRAAGIAEECGYSSLRLALRGADLQGEDVHHAALAADLLGVFKAPDILDDYDEIHVLAYSLGGHMALHAAIGDLPPVVKKIAAICPPFDLQPCQQHIDSSRIYRANLVWGLRAIYRALAKRGRIHDIDLRQVRSIWDWDRLVICKRFGFDDPPDYYERMSIRSRYHQTKVPLLIVGSKHDPLVPFKTVQDHLADSEKVTIRFLKNEGHVSFSRQADLGIQPGEELERQVFGWFGTL
jgi:uncharacterized protein